MGITRREMHRIETEIINGLVAIIRVIIPIAMAVISLVSYDLQDRCSFKLLGTVKFLCFFFVFSGVLLCFLLSFSLYGGSSWVGTCHALFDSGVLCFWGF